MAKKSKKMEIKPGEYLVNEEKKAVVYATKAHGIVFVGTAKCGPKDAFDIERGKAIAKIRATIEQRKFDAQLTRNFIANLKWDINSEISGTGACSPHYMRSIQMATDELNAQIAHIRELKERLNTYTA